MTDISHFTAELIKSMALFLPETSLIVTFLVALAADLLPSKNKHLSGYVLLAGLLATALFLYQQTGITHQSFAGLLVLDPFGQFIKFVILLSTLLVVFFSFQSKELHESHPKLGEYYILMSGMTVGMFLLAGASNLMMIYLSIETMSISSYILTGYTKEVKRATEASLKYVLFGAVASGIMLYGISILFGLTGSLNLTDISSYLTNNQVDTVPLLIAGILIMTGFGYKISAVPFHYWTPDVYEGAPVTITALLSVASKAAGFAVLLRFFRTTFTLPEVIPDTAWTVIGNIDWRFVLAGIAVLTMSLGNLVALWQSNIKRMLAYSSIAHAGYLLMAVAMLDDTGGAAVLIYFFVYALMNLGAFFVVQLVADQTGSEEIEVYSGLGYRNPVIGIVLTIFLISLTGLPPTAGFIGKLYVFTSVVNAGYIWLAVIGVINSVISLYYYVRIIRNMYLRDIESQKTAINVSTQALILLLLLAIPTLVLGVYFSPLIDWANASMVFFIGH